MREPAVGASRRACARATASAAVCGGGVEQAHARSAPATHDALGAHRVALVGHRRRADLLAPRTAPRPRLQAGEQAQVGARTCARSAPMPASAASTREVDLARVGLAGDGEARARSRSAAVDAAGRARSTFVVVAVEEREEGGLRAGRALHAAEAQRRRSAALELLEVEQRGPGSTGRRACRRS